MTLVFFTTKTVGKFQVVSAKVVVKWGRRGKMRFCTYYAISQKLDKIEPLLLSSRSLK